MTREELDLAERRPCRALRDMRLVYDGELDNVSQPVTKSQRMLEKLYDEHPDKFMLRDGKLQLAHDKKLEAMDQREKARLLAQAGCAAPELDEGHVKVEELIDELLEGSTPWRKQSYTNKSVDLGRGCGRQGQAQVDAQHVV